MMLRNLEEDNSPVTVADIESNRIIIDKLSKTSEILS